MVGPGTTDKGGEKENYNGLGCLKTWAGLVQSMLGRSNGVLGHSMLLGQYQMGFYLDWLETIGPLGRSWAGNANVKKEEEMFGSVWFRVGPTETKSWAIY